MGQPPPVHYSPDGRWWWDGQAWQPVAAAPLAPAPIPKKKHPINLVIIGIIGVVFLGVCIGAVASAGNATKTASTASTANPTEPATAVPAKATPAPTPVKTPVPTPPPISEAEYKASAQSIPYPQLIKDPASMAGTVVTYTGQVFQYDANTTTSHMLVSIDQQGYGYWNDHVLLDLPGSLAQNDITQTQVVKFWGTIVGPYTYKTTGGGEQTVPRIEVHYIQHA